MISDMGRVQRKHGMNMSTYSHVLTELRRESAARMNAILAPLATRISALVEMTSSAEG